MREVGLFAGQHTGGFGTPGAVRYPQGGGLIDTERAARERVRLQAAACSETGENNREIAAALRVSERSVERRRRQWRENGHAGVASKGSPGRPWLSDGVFVESYTPCPARTTR
ncbi:helix-turn-helix domain-containing protein [Streptomyces sp. NPDC005181]|uniref:helix-turn-helix domain-containing protein n=1 Tax=Streptomyces sp. NPDC005181 TaxID=3156869 RepID=UPI0033BE8560